MPEGTISSLLFIFNFLNGCLLEIEFLIVNPPVNCSMYLIEFFNEVSLQEAIVEFIPSGVSIKVPIILRFFNSFLKIFSNFSISVREKHL